MRMSNASCLLLLVLGVLVAAAAAHPKKHDPCKYDDHRGWTWAADVGEELDEEAMKKLPEAYVQYGWRHYRSGKCSYKGWQQNCPDYYHKKHGGHHYDEKWWDNYFPERKCLGAHCMSNSTCCSNNCVDGFCCDKWKVGIDQPCTKDWKCCSGSCNIIAPATTGTCCIPAGSALTCTSVGQCCGTSTTVDCKSGTCCKKYNQDCWKNKECCSGTCTSNKCT